MGSVSSDVQGRCPVLMPKALRRSGQAKRRAALEQTTGLAVVCWSEVHVPHRGCQTPYKVEAGSMRTLSPCLGSVRSSSFRPCHAYTRAPDSGWAS